MSKEVFIESHKQSSSDNVNQPSHYTNSNIETIDYIKDKLTQQQFEGYCIGNVTKYLSRYRLKNGKEDLEKAKVYLEWAIENYNSTIGGE